MSGRMRSWRMRSGRVFSAAARAARASAASTTAIALGHQSQTQHLARGRVVLDDEDRGHCGHRSAAELARRAKCSATTRGRASISIGFEHVVVTTRGERLSLVALHRICGERNDDNVAACSVGFEPSRRVAARADRVLHLPVVCGDRRCMRRRERHAAHERVRGRELRVVVGRALRHSGRRASKSCVGGKNAALSAHHHHGVGSGVETSATIPRRKPGVRPCRHRPSASRTLHINPWAVNGFCRNTMLAGRPAC